MGENEEFFTIRIENQSPGHRGEICSLSTLVFVR